MLPPFGIDTVDGGAGIDTLAFADVYVRAEDYELYRPPSMIVDLGLGQVRVKGVSGPASSIAAVENVTTSSGDDRVFGSTGNNVIRLGSGLNEAFGGAGDDTIHGGEWAYSYYPGIGGDPSSGFQEVLSGGAGNDTIFGNGAYWLYVEGNIAIVDRATERLDGGAGNDRLVTGAADATVSGGSGADRFEFRDDYWSDEERGIFPDGFDHTVTDFDPTGGDKLVFSMLDVAPGAPDPILVGETDFASLDVHELGYRVEASTGGGNDIVLRMKFQPEGYGPNPNILPVMTVTLRGYDAGLSADDILFA